MLKRQEHFIPALAYHFLTPLYDPVMRTLLRETRFKRHLLALAEIESGQQVLDLGCGTATLTLLLKRQYPETTVVGLDADPEALKLARRKLTQALSRYDSEHHTRSCLERLPSTRQRKLETQFILCSRLFLLLVLGASASLEEAWIG